MVGRWARQRPGSWLDQVGVVNHGRGPRFDGVHDALRAAGFAPELLGVNEAQSRWPGIRFDSQVRGAPEAGRLNADASVAALQQSGSARGWHSRRRPGASRCSATTGCS